jgi:hypothetical protein
MQFSGRLQLRTNTFWTGVSDQPGYSTLKIILVNKHSSLLKII